MRTLIALVILSVIAVTLPAQEIKHDIRTNKIMQQFNRDADIKKNTRRLSPWRPDTDSKAGHIMLKNFSVDGKQKLDSVISEVYNEEPGIWITDSKEEYHYDGNANETEFLYLNWDNENREWMGSIKAESMYDKDNNLTQTILSQWDNNDNDWKGYSKTEFTYENSLLISLREYYIDESINGWSLSTETSFEYTDGQLVNMILGGIDLNEDGIINEQDQIKTSYFYDPMGNLLRDITYIYDDADEGWYAVMKNENTYTAENRLESSTTYFKNENNEWHEYFREFIGYDENGNIIKETYSSWDYEQEDWFNEEIWDYTFNPEGALVTMMLSEWDYETGSTSPIFKNEFTHNSSFSLNDLILPNEYPREYFGQMITGYSQYDYIDDSWILTYRGKIHYSDFNSTGIRDIYVPGISVFPNPASDIVTFAGTSPGEQTLIEFFDITGKKVLSQNLPMDGRVSVNDFQPGLYYFKIINQASEQTGKLIIN